MVVQEKSQERPRNVCIVTFRAFWNLPTLDRIQKSIPIEQERSVLHFLGAFPAGPPGRGAWLGPARKVPKVPRLERSWPTEIGFGI